MSNSDAANIARAVNEVTEDLNAWGFAVDRDDVDAIIYASDVQNYGDAYNWVEAAPGDADGCHGYPHVAFCTCGYAANAAVQVQYKRVRQYNPGNT